MLLDRVYEAVYQSKWNPLWEQQITDRSTSLEDRLCRFYIEYAQIILTYEWVRLFMFAGLKGLNFNSRYLDFLRTTMFDRITSELRFSNGVPEDGPVRSEEIELIWGLHASIFYLGVRRWIYGLPTPSDQESDVALRVVAFLRGAPAALYPLRGNSARDAPPALPSPRPVRRERLDGSASIRSLAGATPRTRSGGRAR